MGIISNVKINPNATIIERDVDNQKYPPPCAYGMRFPIIESSKLEPAMREKMFIAGKLSDEYKVPEISILVAKNNDLFKATAIIDTGAYHTCMKRSLIKKLGIIPGNGSTKQGHPIMGVIEAPIYRVVFLFEGFNEVFNHDFTEIIAPYPYDIIIGTDLLSQMESFIYLGKENRFELIV